MNTRRLHILFCRRAALRIAVTSALYAFILLSDAVAQNSEIPLEHCDRLPVVKVSIADKEMHFLVDTGATTILNLKSFAGGNSKQIHISSWRGTADTSAREVSLPSFRLGAHTLHDLKLPAIDLSPIGKACGGIIDGLLGVDLLDAMGVTIDLKRQIASLGAESTDPAALYREMDSEMGHCTGDFEQGKADQLEKCFDPEIVVYCPGGEFKGRSEVMRHMREHYFKFIPKLHYVMKVRDMQAFGNALWYSYDYEMDLGEKRMFGRGMAMCRKTNGRWMILNMHNSLREPDEEALLQK
jgi:SnoaL-like domain/Aspartyl protease